MQRIAAMNSKKKILFGVGLIVLIIATIITGLYVTNRTNANQSLTNVSTPKEANMNLDVKVQDGQVEAQSISNATESGDTSSSDTQQGATNTSNSNINVQVNGTPIDVPENGTVYKEIITDDGSATINFKSESSSSSNDTRTRSKINIDVDSSVQVRSSN